jgi:hypothetical protein
MLPRGPWSKSVALRAQPRTDEVHKNFALPADPANALPCKARVSVWECHFSGSRSLSEYNRCNAAYVQGT